MQEYATNIAIGGVLPVTELPGLLKAASFCGAALDWNGDRLDETDDDLEALRDMIEDAAKEGEPLRLYNDTAGWGKLEALETFCREHGLAYRREHDPDHGDDGMVAWWMPGLSEPTEKPADSDGEPYVHVKDVMKTLDAAKTPKAAVAAVRDLLARHEPFDVTVLTLRP